MTNVTGQELPENFYTPPSKGIQISLGWGGGSV